MVGEKGKIVPQKLSREAYRALESVVGKEWVSEDPAIIESYVINCVDAGQAMRVIIRHPLSRPAAVVLPVSTEEVQGVVKVANRYAFPILPHANAQLFSGPTVPGTVLVNMRRMDKIEVDEEHMRMTIQPFVNYAWIHHEAIKRGLWLGGSGWHGAIAKPCSQYSVAGLWQSDLKYSGLGRSTLGLKVVLADGSLLRLGSSAVSGTDDISFTERFPGPNLMGFIKCSLGSRGIITEITLKLYPWPGGYPMPEDRGRPCIERFFEDCKEKKFDRPPTPNRFRIFWFEYPDLDSLTNGVAKLARSGCGVALDITGDYNAMMCSYTIAEANERSKGCFHRMGYIYIGGFSSERQLDYEEKVVRHIVAETGGRLLSAEYKPELLDAQAPWNVEVCLNTETGMRTVRSGYMIGTIPPYGTFDEIKDGSEVWADVIRDSGAVGEERGEYFGRDSIECPYGYIADRGHQMTVEMDQFPERDSLEEVATFFRSLIHAFGGWVKKGYPGSWCLDIGEPWMSVFPEIGPDTHLLLRKYQEMRDPKAIFAPGRIAWTTEQFKAAFKEPSRTMQMMLAERDRAGLPKRELTPEGDDWKPAEE